ncbi:MAG: polysaccharide biosynthesis tyrosine autokinase [Oscillospiraceae bacterium]|nr:polysaccharide biosynthesis tyrosine autokinase [Oscillospiraceae bacterium]
MEKKKEFQAEEYGLLPYDPIVIVIEVLRRWLLILMVTVLVGTAVFTVSDFRYTPKYRASATLVVTSRGTSSTVYSNMVSTANLAKVLTELLGSTVFHQVILEDTGLEAFDGSISATQVPDTNLLTMYVTSSDPRSAFLVAEAILNNYEAVTAQVVGEVVLEVLQKPTVPMAPMNPRTAMSNAKQAMMLAAVAMFGLLAWISCARDSIRSSREVRTKLHCHYLGDLPHERRYKSLKARLRRNGNTLLISNPATSFRFSEAVRKLRRSVEQQMAGNTLMVVSLLPNEGKSTVAVNLAMALAKKHSKVLLIDCDLRKPSCARQMGIKWETLGVRDVLSGNSVPRELIQHDSRSNLDVLLQRGGSMNSGDLVSSHRMKMLIEWAKKSYDFVVLDMPPMAQVTDAESVMNTVDSTLLVVRQNAAPSKSLNKAIEALNQGQAKLLGCVLNNVYATGFFSGQGYGNAYGHYGQYSHYDRYGRYNHYGKYGKYGNYGKYGDTNAYEAYDFEKQD